MKLKKPKNKLLLTLITLTTLLLIFSFPISIFAAETGTVDEQIEDLKDIISSSSNYSSFQTRMVLNTAQELLESGVSFENTKRLIENSVEKSLDAYNIKKVFDIILETQQEGLPIEPLINKITEGFAKNVEKTKIISAVSTKAKNLKKANKILSEARQEGLERDDEEEIIIILANSLENDVPSNSLSWLIKKGTTQGKSIKEITEISEELSYLSLMALESGLSPEKISLLFEKSKNISNNIEEICENIQKNLEAEISTAKIEGGGTAKPSMTTSSGTLSTSSTEGSEEAGETPTQEAGEAPTETESAPEEPSTPPEEEGTPPPPEN